MNPQAIKKYLVSWKLVNQRQVQELRKLPMIEKIRQLDAMLRLAMGMGIDLYKGRDLRHARAHWLLLKGKCGS